MCRRAYIYELTKFQFSTIWSAQYHSSFPLAAALEAVKAGEHNTRNASSFAVRAFDSTSRPIFVNFEARPEATLVKFMLT